MIGITPAALLVAASIGASLVQPFEVVGVDTNIPNSPMLTNPDLFQSSFFCAGDTGPDPGCMNVSMGFPNQYVVFDSYVAIESSPSVACPFKGCGFQANPGDLTFDGLPFAIPGEVGGRWYFEGGGIRDGAEAIAQASLAGVTGVFLGRYSFRSTDGSIPTGDLVLGSGGITIQVRDPNTFQIGHPSTDTLLIHFSDFNTPNQMGTDVDGSGPFQLGHSYQLVKVTSEVGPVFGGVARWHVVDLYISTHGTTGACCIAGLTCVENQSLGQCDTLGGVYVGDGSFCSSLGCPLTGACCLDNGGCLQLQEDACSFWYDGVFLGPGISCASGGCPATGACCDLTAGACVTLTEGACLALPRPHRYRGDGTFCGSNDCICHADANGDSVTDAADLSFVLGVFGVTVSGFPAAAPADLNHDGIVNGADLSVLLANFGDVC